MEETALRQEQLDLQENEAYKAAAKKKELQLTLDREVSDKQRREESLLEKQRREVRLTEQIKDEEHKLYLIDKQAAEAIESLTQLAVEADFSAHEGLKQGFNLADAEVKGYFEL